MTKKSRSRIQRDVAEGKRRADANTLSMPSASRNALKPNQAGGYKLSPVDRILSDCAMGVGMIPKKQTNTCWDDLMGVYRECAGMLFQHSMVTEVLNDKELTTFVEDISMFNANVAQFAADLAQMNIELQQLRALHAGKVGGSEDPQVVLHSFAIYEQYKLWMTKHDGVVKPGIMHILEQTNAAELRRQAAIQSALNTGADPVENLDGGVLDLGHGLISPAYEIADVEYKEAPRLNLQASIDAGLEAERISREGAWTVDQEEAAIKHSDLSTASAESIVNTAMRGQVSSYSAIDEAGFLPIDAVTPHTRTQA